MKFVTDIQMEGEQVKEGLGKDQNRSNEGNARYQHCTLSTKKRILSRQDALLLAVARYDREHKDPLEEHGKMGLNARSGFQLGSVAKPRMQ